MRSMHAVTLLAIAGSAAAVHAQDSTANTPGLPGDAINPLAANQQVLSYVADLTPFGTSWGTTFGIVPIMKGVRTDPLFFTGFVGANGISDDLLQDAPYASESYGLWEAAPGVGVNPDSNTAPSMFVSPTGVSSQFAVGMDNSLEINGFSGDSISTAIVNYNPAEPNRLYVTRIEAGSTVDAAGTGSSGSGVFSSLDADGNTYVRTDGFGSGGALSSPSGENWFRLRADERASGTVNLLDGTGAADASDWLLVNSGNRHPQPSNIPASVAGGDGLVAGANFSSQFVRGATAPLTSAADHYGQDMSGFTPSDHRGQIGTTTRSLLNSGVATSAIAAIDAPGDTRQINVWSTDAAGNVVEAHSFAPPFTLVDPTDGKTINYIPNTSQFRQYVGITGFRSDAGMVALGQDADGNNYAGAVLSEFGVSFDLAMQSVVVRFDENGDNEEWSIIGWTDAAGNGKEILDGPGGNSIGNLVPFRTAFPTAGPLGPSMSTPTFDGAGNAWFLASAALDKIDPVTMEPFIDFDTVLIRAVRTDVATDPGADFGYELELVLELGRTFFGQNSGLRYQIQFMDTVAASGDGGGSGVSSPSAMNSNNGRAWGWDNSDLTGVDNADPITNGGIVLQADIVYDVNEDGVYEDPTGGNADPMSPDQSYQTLLYVGYYADGPQPCNIADLAEPFGVLDLQDIGAFVGGFTSQMPIADLDGNGIYDLTDIGLFVSNFTAGCP